MSRTLASISQRPEFRQHYERFVAELVYGDARPGFDEAFRTFAAGAGALLRDCNLGTARQPLVAVGGLTLLAIGSILGSNQQQLTVA